MLQHLHFCQKTMQIVKVKPSSPVSILTSSESSTTLDPETDRKLVRNKEGHPVINQHTMLGPSLSRSEAEKIITRKVKSILARGEPLDRLLDDQVKAEMIADFPSIEKFLPRDQQTIYLNYVIPIDQECLLELENFIKKLPGQINISMDGATVNGKQKVRY